MAQVLEVDGQDPRHIAPWGAVTSCRVEQAEEPRQVLAERPFLWAALDQGKPWAAFLSGIADRVARRVHLVTSHKVTAGH